MNAAFSNVSRVYSGKIGCMCGCRGTYSRPSVADDPTRNKADSCTRVNDRAVKIIYNKVMSHPSVKFVDNVAYVTSATRTIAVYFREGS